MTSVTESTEKQQQIVPQSTKKQQQASSAPYDLGENRPPSAYGWYVLTAIDHPMHDHDENGSGADAAEDDHGGDDDENLVVLKP